ncbi:MAG: TlpA family protein disulfide reductase [Myxococcota bacterium]
MLLALLLACPPPSPGDEKPGDGPAGDGDTGGDTGSGTTHDTGPSCVVEPEPPDEKQAAGDPWAARVLDGTVTWTLTFDETAEAAGFEDCTYTRVYEGVTEIGDRGWLCPDCEVQAVGTAVMTEGYEGCYLQIDDDPVERVEHLGLGEIDGATHFFRSGNENVSLGDMGAIVGEDTFDVAWEDTADLTDGGTLLLAATGTFTLSTSETEVVEDVAGARTEPYACGWPLNSPGGAVEQWTLETGAPFPNARLEDQCGEPVDIWDFRGFYLVVDASAPNCGPCQAMAEAAEPFKAKMAASCIPVEMVTLLAVALDDINHPASVETRLDWADTFGLASPVLGDLGFGYALFPDYVGTESGISFPSIVVVDPAGDVIFGTSGFSSFDEIEAVIRADWEG